MTKAIEREKKLKEWQRIWKIRLIERMNPEWHDLFDKTTGEIHFGTADVEAAAEPESPHVSGPRPPSG